MELTPRQRRALEDISDTFCPSGKGVPTARGLGVADAVIEALSGNPRISERKQLQALLGLWDTPALGALAGGGFKHFSAMAPEEREAVVLSWANSRLPQRRAVFQALRKATLLFYYMLPGGGGKRSAVWDAIGYDGPLGKLEGADPKR